MHRALAPLLLCPLVLALPAGEVAPADDQALLELSLPDLAQTRERFAASLFGRIWLQEDLAPLRQELDKQVAALRQGQGPLSLFQAIGPEFWDFYRQGDGFEMRLLRREQSREPAFSLQFRGAESVPALAQAYTAFDERHGGPEPRPYAQRLIENRWLFAAPAELAEPLDVPETDTDLLLRWHPRAIAALIASQASPHERELLQRLVQELLPAGRWLARFAPEGLSHDLHLDAEPVGLTAVDEALLARLAPDSLMVGAVGIDGAAWWQAHEALVWEVLAAQSGGDLDAARQQVDGLVQGVLGLPGGLAELAGAVRGTVALQMGSGDGILPSITLFLPRSPALDRVLEFACVMASSQQPPTEGAWDFLVLRGMAASGRAGIALAGAALGRDAGHWCLSLDPLFLEDWLAGSGGGWTETAIGRDALAFGGADARMITAVDTPRILRSWLPLLGGVTSLPAEGRYASELSHAAFRLARTAGPEFACARVEADGLHLRSLGPGLGVASPGVGQMAVVAAIAIPNLLQSRERARRVRARAIERAAERDQQEDPLDQDPF